MHYKLHCIDNWSPISSRLLRSLLSSFLSRFTPRLSLLPHSPVLPPHLIHLVLEPFHLVGELVRGDAWEDFLNVDFVTARQNRLNRAGNLIWWRVWSTILFLFVQFICICTRLILILQMELAWRFPRCCWSRWGKGCAGRVSPHQGSTVYNFY